MNFDLFNLHPRILKGVQAEGYKTPTPIQLKAIPNILKGCDVMGLAQTGTGKTAAFMLPILNRLMTGRRNKPRALVIAPTRELAEQIHHAALSLSRHTRAGSITLYGGVSISAQVQKLKKGVEIVVGCPGRILDHIGRGAIDLSNIETVVLDEADQMFDMGFLPGIRRILAELPANRQTLMFSATMPDEIRKLARDILKNPVEINIGAAAPAKSVRHALFPVARDRKKELLLALLKKTDIRSVLVFTRTKHRAKKLGEQLAKAGYRAASIQGNLSQNQRRAAMDGFRDGKFQILVATDIAARGIDVSNISHVINFDVPSTPEAYIHRIGRTGRAACEGDAFTLFTSEEEHMARSIDRVLGMRVDRRLLEGFDLGDARSTNKRARRGPMPNRPGNRGRSLNS
jgi:ATP-dependent RNA helicase RhlE